MINTCCSTRYSASGNRIQQYRRSVWDCIRFSIKYIVQTVPYHKKIIQSIKKWHNIVDEKKKSKQTYNTIQFRLLGKGTDRFDRIHYKTIIRSLYSTIIRSWNISAGVVRLFFFRFTIKMRTHTFWNILSILLLLKYLLLKPLKLSEFDVEIRNGIC